MDTIEIVLTDLSFPDDLNDKYCKFRPLISVKYKDSKGKSVYAREALPGLGKRDYWECEKDNKKKSNWVRHETEPKVDMDKVDISKREIVFEDLDIKELKRVTVEIFDVDIKSGWEKWMQTGLKMLPPDAMALINPALPLTLTMVKEAVQKGTGKNVGDLEKDLINRLIGKEDGAARSIWTKSKTLKEPPDEPLVIKGGGDKGNFSVTLEMDVS